MTTIVKLFAFTEIARKSFGSVTNVGTKNGIIFPA